jgi:hypothetical protein
VSYRDDLGAAQARAEAAERRAAALQKQLDARDTQARIDVPEVPIPDRFTVARAGDELTVSWRWFKPHHIFMLFFVIAWDAFLVFWYTGLPSQTGDWMFFVFPLAHVAAGVGLTYATLTGFLNRTFVSARFGRLHVRHAPLPWRGNRTLARSDIRQLYVIEVERSDEGRRTASTWDLCALLETGKELKLVRKLDSHGQGLYLEDVFEQHLGIRDGNVVSEVPKKHGRTVGPPAA